MYLTSTLRLELITYWRRSLHFMITQSNKTTLTIIMHQSKPNQKPLMKSKRPRLSKVCWVLISTQVKIFQKNHKWVSLIMQCTNYKLLILYIWNHHLLTTRTKWSMKKLKLYRKKSSCKSWRISLILICVKMLIKARWATAVPFLIIQRY